MIRPNTDHRARLLILDEDRIVRESLAGLLRRDGYDVRTVDRLSDAQTALTDHAVDVLLADLDLPGIRPTEALSDLRRRSTETAVVVLSRYGSVDGAKEATRGGAADYLTKPFADEDVRTVLERVIRRQALLVDTSTRRSRLDRRDGLEEIVGRDAKMQRVFDLAEAVADSRTSVLILGESGTGKSMLARAIHARSPRRDRPFVEVACGSLPDALLESELFGHVKGGFTGAVADKPGRFVTADGGTLFLDEINSAPPHMQVKLLRVLQERRLEPVGSDVTRQVDVRSVLASNADLSAMVAAGTFRQDLFYRINVVTLHLPPLRDRPGDIPALAETFLQKFAAEANRRVIGFTPAAIQRLADHAWPGNVRELENAIERAVVLSRRPTIDADDLPEAVAPARPAASPVNGTRPLPALPLEVALEEPERRIIEAALDRNAWNRNATAAELAINRTTLYKKMRKHGLDIGERN
ncbi:MAG TPA: sigma-54 dependent transcriptional regulator [Tepidisphaeraceae bacterium]